MKDSVFSIQTDTQHGATFFSQVCAKSLKHRYEIIPRDIISVRFCGDGLQGFLVPFIHEYIVPYFSTGGNSSSLGSISL